MHVKILLKAGWALSEFVGIHARTDTAEQGAYDMTAAEPTLRANQAKDYEVLHKSVFEMLRPTV
ncbi:hypothetical protein GWA01_09040 [Gluconobacter wancherniae NBRC 103581]|uniref:Uncharacterized protein n=1 Tax=Gluconobacter wancherniae NBRC 103581 TaxID=656744 RepID=A0A511AY64_9PROT|nr:hypothetical protein AA103581_0555 [Gluconobacter wancherniae NBRC 103581]GEK93134.1 hypothetical protein GWA01_09040 [Gluconobacter wancherniae NBRC 103581]